MDAPFHLTTSQRLKARAIAAAGYPLVEALGRTLSWSVDGFSHYEDAMRAGRPPILALWHGRILPATLFWRDRGIVAITSANFDGEWTARLMARFGYRAARGSTSRGGSRALVQLRRELSVGNPVAFTVDGPRGPVRVIQRGAIFLAAVTERPVIPFHIEASRHWTLRSWDAAQIPRPFSRVAVAIGAPLFVADRSDEGLDAARGRLQVLFGEIESRARLLSRHAP